MLDGAADRYEAEKRYLRPEGATRWALVSASLVRGPGGRALRLLAAVRDETERKLAEERQALLMREVDHRAKNALAVVQSAVRMTPKTDPEAFAAPVEGRVLALARAHNLLAERRWEGVDLGELLRGELGPFVPAGAGGAGGERVLLDGPPVTLAPDAAQAISMAVHELATNATKHGALSVATGRVAIARWIDTGAGMLRLRWREAGGPPLAGAPARRGAASAPACWR
jgi:two-component sensor histidine kinase